MTLKEFPYDKKYTVYIYVQDHNYVSIYDTISAKNILRIGKQQPGTKERPG